MVLSPRPSRVETWLRQGLAAHAEGRTDEAVKLYERVLRETPSAAEALYRLGEIRVLQRQDAVGVPLLRRAAALRPQSPAIHGLLGSALSRLQSHIEALEAFDRVVALRPDHALAWLSRATPLRALGRLDDALASLEHALSLHPGHAEAWRSHAVVLRELGRPRDALASIERALRVAPGDREPLIEKAAILRRLGRIDEALDCCRRAIALEPTRSDAWLARAGVLHEADLGVEAIEACDRAIALEPRNAVAWMERAAMKAALGRREESLRDFESVLDFDPTHVEARLNRAHRLLQAGRLNEGWPELEARKLKWAQTLWPLKPSRAWTGKGDVKGRRLLLYAEQGLGDTIQFARYAPALATMGAHTQLAVQPALVGLLRQLTPGTPVRSLTDPMPPHDLHCSLLSAPLAMATTLQSIPSPGAYLAAAPLRAVVWDEILGLRARPRVGLAWSGNPGHENDLQRTIPFALLADLLETDVAWFVAQNEIRAGEIDAVAAATQLSCPAVGLTDFGETAALIAALDLVITVDTSIAHLAGALGKPVWVLLSFDPDWRWLLERSDSPWYASARLFRQSRADAWRSVLADVRAELEVWARNWRTV